MPGSGGTAGQVLGGAGGDAAPSSTSVSPRPVPAAPPVRVRIPAVGVAAPVRPSGTDPAGALDLPADPRTLAWWTGGARPGDARGSVVLAGHVDDERRGDGALVRLREVRPGAVVEVDTADGTRRYVVTARRTYRKTALPAAVFARMVAGRLVLITCTGRFDPDTRSYADNLVVYAVPQP